MKTAAVIVTYSNRYNFLERVVDSLQCQDIVKIVIVNNNSSNDSFNNMHRLKELYNGRIRIVDLHENLGSSVAFNRGIEEALKCNDADFLWLLDDDNYTEENSLSKLKSIYREINKNEPANRLVLSSFRINRDFFYKAVKLGKPELCVGTNNTFRSFNISDEFNKLNLFRSKVEKESDAEWGEVGSAPFGGMFLHRSVIEEMGIFDESFILYCDDTEFSCRVRDKGGKIYCVLNSKITDLEDSWNNNVFAPHLFSTCSDYQRLYYNIRNRVYLEKKYLVTCWPIYLLNMMIYSSIVYSISVFHGNFRNMKIFTRAIYDGLIGKLGYNEKYPL